MCFPLIEYKCFCDNGVNFRSRALSRVFVQRINAVTNYFHFNNVWVELDRLPEVFGNNYALSPAYLGWVYQGFRPGGKIYTVLFRHPGAHRKIARAVHGQRRVRAVHRQQGRSESKVFALPAFYGRNSYLGGNSNRLLQVKQAHRQTAHSRRLRAGAGVDRGRRNRPEGF